MSGNSINPVVAIVHIATGNRHSTSGQPTNVGSNGNYWSGTPSSAANGRNLGFNSGTVSPQSSNNRAFGFAARCVAVFLTINMCMRAGFRFDRFVA